MYSGKIRVFTWVHHTTYFFGAEKSSTPESNSSRLGWHCCEPGFTSSALPNITRHSNRCRRPPLSTPELFKLQHITSKQIGKSDIGKFSAESETQKHCCQIKKRFINWTREVCLLTIPQDNYQEQGRPRSRTLIRCAQPCRSGQIHGQRCWISHPETTVRTSRT